MTHSTSFPHPEADSRWTPSFVPVFHEPSFKAWVLTDKRSTQHYVLPQRPYISRDILGQPRFSLRLFLSHPPQPDDEGFASLITGGELDVDVTLALPGGVQFGFEPTSRPLLIHSAMFSVIDRYALDNPLALSGVDTSGTASLHAVLGRVQAQHVLDALDGSNSPVSITAAVQYEVNGIKPFRLTGMWGSIYDVLCGRPGAEEGFARDHLRVHLSWMIRQGVVMVYLGEESHPIRDNFLPPEAVEHFIALADVILRFDPASERYFLRSRPFDLLMLEAVVPLSQKPRHIIHLSSPLRQMLEDAGITRDSSAALQFVIGS